MRAAVVLILIFALALTGCEEEKSALNGTAQQEAASAIEEPGDLVNTGSLPAGQDQTNLTPYQFLNLGLGNAEDFCIDYTVFDYETKEHTTGYFQKSGEKYAAVFSARDMNGNSVSVRELEMEGRVFYIMADAKHIRSYLAPAEDFLIYVLMEAAAGKEKNVYEQEGFWVYEYEKPFAQDESIPLNYRLFMRDGTLRKAEYSVDGRLSVTYEFSGFQQIEKYSEVFEYPAGYSEEWLDYPYTGETMPPWWEIGNDE